MEPFMVSRGRLSWAQVSVLSAREPLGITQEGIRLTLRRETTLSWTPMRVIADICVIPNTGHTSVRQEVARAHEILAATGLEVRLHAYGTNIEGDYDTIFAALRSVHEELHANGAPRISTTIRLGSRTDKQQGIDDKIAAVNDELDI